MFIDYNYILFKSKYSKILIEKNIFILLYPHIENILFSMISCSESFDELLWQAAVFNWLTHIF